MRPVQSKFYSARHNASPQSCGAWQCTALGASFILSACGSDRGRGGSHQSIVRGTQGVVAISDGSELNIAHKEEAAGH